MIQDLTDVTKGMQEEDLVQVTLECPDLDFPIRLPFMQMNQLTHGSFLYTGSALMFLLQMVIQVILSSVQQSAFVTWKEAVVVVLSLVSIEIVLSSKT
jgi:hypothetical protein